VKVFNWLFTSFRGRIVFLSPMLWFLGFVIAFTIGGMAGVLMSVPPVDFQVHNSLFLIAHFHSVIIPGVVFGFFAAFTYWFPKIMGYKLNERLGKWAAWCWILGFLIAFMPLYQLGFMGATRRLDHYEASTGWQPFFIVAAVGAAVITVGFCIQMVQLFVSVVRRKNHRDTTGDPWDGRTLEWSTSSPPPFYNFAVIPEVHSRDAFWEMKKEKVHKKPVYHDILMPKNSYMGLITALFASGVVFAIVWHMWPLAILSLLGTVACLIARLCDDEVEFIIPASEVEKIEAARGAHGIHS